MKLSLKQKLAGVLSCLILTSNPALAAEPEAVAWGENTTLYLEYVYGGPSGSINAVKIYGSNKSNRSKGVRFTVHCFWSGGRELSGQFPYHENISPNANQEFLIRCTPTNQIIASASIINFSEDR